MSIEFDPATGGYYQIVYNGQVPERLEVVEPPPPPPEQEAAPPPVEETQPFVDLPAPSDDPSLQPNNSGYPGGPTTGSIVDEVV